MSIFFICERLFKKKTMEEFPNEILVIIFEYVATQPKDYTSWSLVSKRFRCIAKANSHEILTKGIRVLLEKNKCLEKKKEKMFDHFLEREKGITNNLRKKVCEISRLRKELKTKEEENESIRQKNERSQYLGRNLRY
ncbi:hypothetical protein [Brazilian marseillevirus]|uniref:hypothetical protein n=1 Tax=Brazilian marseillevirus TaxID=1813599 RepID=UPI000785414C|nr:hypothetical protein A3303_gp052 [Brazilian marseillevirus]AMQ10560.1 hypothetical protein [Brazilian marseillevirus]